MNYTLRSLFLILALTAGMIRLPAQDAGPTDATTDTTSTTAPAGSTVINSDELRMDEGTDGRVAVFTGNVTVDGTNFKMTCEEMTVTFTKDSKVDTITAKGQVVIIQPGRITHSGVAQYFHDDDKFILTDQPTILDNGNQIAAPKITIFRTKGSLYTEGRTTTTIASGHGLDAGPTAPATPSDSSAK